MNGSKSEHIFDNSYSINQLSRDLSVPPNRISEIVNGKKSITADTALRLQRYFGVEAQFWLNLQTEYNLRMIKRKIWSDIERRIIPVKTTETGIEMDWVNLLLFPTTHGTPCCLCWLLLPSNVMIR